MVSPTHHSQSGQALCLFSGGSFLRCWHTYHRGSCSKTPPMDRAYTWGADHRDPAAGKHSPGTEMAAGTRKGDAADLSRAGALHREQVDPAAGDCAAYPECRYTVRLSQGVNRADITEWRRHAVRCSGTRCVWTLLQQRHEPGHGCDGSGLPQAPSCALRRLFSAPIGTRLDYAAASHSNVGLFPWSASAEAATSGGSESGR